MWLRFWNSLLAGVLAVLLPSSASAQPPITALVFAPDGKHVVAGSQLGIAVRGWPSLEVVREIDTALGHVHDLAFSPAGDRLLVGGGSPAQYGGYEVFSWPDSRLLHAALPHDDIVYGVSWAEDGDEFATASGDEQVALWGSATGARQKLLAGHSRRVLAVAYLSGADLLVSAGVDQSLRVWDRASGELVRTLDNHTDVVRCLAVRPGEGGLPMVASAGADRTIRFWQPTIGRLIRFVRLPAEPLSLAWTPEGARLVVGSSDGHVRGIDPDTLEIVSDHKVLDGWVYEVALPPSGNEFAVGGTGGRIVRVEIE